MKYDYKKPEKVSFSSLLEDCTNEYDDSTEEARKRVMLVNVWAYGVCSSLPNPPEDDGWGGTPYNQPGCIPS